MNGTLTLDESPDPIGDALRECGQTVESMLDDLREECARVLGGRYPQSPGEDEEAR